MRQATNGAVSPKFTIRILSGVAAMALLAGCQVAQNGGDATRATPAGDSVQLIERDVEAPEVFSVEDRGLWDGRPSLGGIWVAAPGVAAPERVIIRNTENGKFVVGALFNRERDNPGPSLQLSSDAAAALDVFAGAPVMIDVVALRREEVEEPAIADLPDIDESLDEATLAVDDIVDTAAPATEADDSIAAATRALDAAEASEAGTTLPEAAAETAEAATDAIGTGLASGAESAAEVADATVTAAQPRRNWFQRVFGRKGNAAADVDPGALGAAVDEPAPLPGQPDPAVSSAAVPSIEASSLDGTQSGENFEAYVQVGIFSDEANAAEASDKLRGSGILSSVVEEESGGSAFWRVVVGPSTNPADRAAVLRTARDLGFDDAFAVRS